MLSPDFLELRNINKIFNESGKNSLQILKNLSMTLVQSSITGIIGRSGAGKSTLLRCLTLLEKPDSGEILLQGRNLLRLPAKDLRQLRRKVGFVPQSVDLLNHVTVRNNIALPLALAGAKDFSSSALIEATADLVGIRDKLDSYPRQLSGGQRQRAAIARALITKPALLLCDEFTSALDPQTTDEIANLLLKIRDATGVTVVLITHDMSLLSKICDFIHVLEEGQFVDGGKLSTLRSSSTHPVTRSLLKYLEAI